MSEITKLYENANITPKKCSECDNNMDCGFGKDCYPPFIAEKQIGIVKLILFSTWWMNLKRLQFSEEFDEGLAQMINELWQDLTEEERKQIADILKG